MVWLFIKEFYKQYKKSVLSVLGVIFWIIIFVVLSRWISEDTEVYETIQKQLPFYDLFDLIGKIAGYEEELPDIGTQAVSVSVFKALLTSTVKGILFSVLMLVCNIILRVPKLTDFLSPSAWINAMEDKSKSAEYIIAGGLITFLTTWFSGVLVSNVVDFANEKLDSMGGAQATAIAVIVLAAFFLIYSMVCAWRENREMQYGILRVYITRIIPELFSLFIIDMLCFFLYADYSRDGFSLSYLLIFIGLAVYSNIDDKIQQSLTLVLVKLTGLKKKDGLSLGQFLLWTVCGFCTMLLVYLMILINLEDESASRLFSFSSFPFVSALIQNQPVGELFLAQSSGFWENFFALLIVGIVIVLLVKRPLVRGLGGMAFYVILWGGVALLAGVAANKAVRWVLEQDSNGYEGIFAVVVAAILLAALLSNYQVLIASAAGAVLILCVFQALASAGISLANVKAGIIAGELSVMGAYVVLCLAACLGGAFSYAFRRK